MVVALSITRGVIEHRVTGPDCQVMYILRKHAHMTPIVCPQ
jgi:hypothetical protein